MEKRNRGLDVNKPIAIFIFGRICSGKTTLARNLEDNNNFKVISKDRCILESELHKRHEEDLTWEEIRESTVNEFIANNYNVVIDETARVGRVSSLKKAGYTIIGVHLNIPLDICRKRLVKRQERRREILSSLSQIIKLDVTKYPQEARRKLWTSLEVVNSIPEFQREYFNELINEIYTLGCDYIKEENPNPTCFPELDYVVEFDGTIDLSSVSLACIINNKISYCDYLIRKHKSIKYCIWDIGGVVYKFSLKPLDTWCKHHTINPNKAKEDYTIKRYDFDNYMIGNVRFEELCSDICSYYDIPFEPRFINEIEQMLWDGVSNDFEITHQLIAKLKKRGTKNCILSNALPVLLESGKYQEYIDKDHRFYSFDLKLLKPSPEIYIKVRDLLQCDFHEMVFVDDKEENVNAARELGIYSIKFDMNIASDPYFRI